MLRLFTAIPIPAHIAAELAKAKKPLPGARWTEPEDLHITLRFAGDMQGPLDGIRVLEIANYIAVPAAATLLAELGADVVKVEVPWGEVYRHATPRPKSHGSPDGVV